MPDALLEQTRTLTELTGDLARSLPEEAFTARISGRSNTIGAQLWCMVGARESYLRAFREGAWQGFSCSVSDEETSNKTAMLAALARSREEWMDEVGTERHDDQQAGMVLRLNEHEAQHHGQLIRYVYHLGYQFPESWKDHWALSD